MLKITDGTLSDIRQFYGRDLPRTARIRVAKTDEGEVVGILGYYPDGRWLYAFSDMRECVSGYSRQVIREVKRFLNELDRPAYCLASNKFPGSRKLLERLGWQHVETVPEGEVYVWLTH